MSAKHAALALLDLAADLAAFAAGLESGGYDPEKPVQQGIRDE